MCWCVWLLQVVTSVTLGELEERAQHEALRLLLSAGHGVHLHELVVLVLVNGARPDCPAPGRLADMLRTLCNVGIVPLGQVRPGAHGGWAGPLCPPSLALGSGCPGEAFALWGPTATRVGRGTPLCSVHLRTRLPFSLAPCGCCTVIACSAKLAFSNV